MPAELPLTSREYKLMLLTERFSDREEGKRLFIDVLTKLVEDQNAELLIKPDDDKRVISFLDTDGWLLNEKKCAIRLRENKKKQETEINLKFRSPDRSFAAKTNVTSPEASKIKFEEDIIPTLQSRFSHSNTIVRPSPSTFANVGEAMKSFPGLADLNIPDDEPLKIVRNLHAFETSGEIGMIKLGQVGLEPCLNFWAESKEKDAKLFLVEFSFGYKSGADGFSDDVIRRADSIFTSLQETDWYDPNGSTKTEFVFNPKLK